MGISGGIFCACAAENERRGSLTSSLSVMISSRARPSQTRSDWIIGQKMRLWVCLVCVWVAGAAATGGPEQVHISFGYQQPSQMFVVWSTAEFGDSLVAYGRDQFHLDSWKNGSCWRFTLGNPRGLQYMHRVLLEV